LGNCKSREAYGILPVLHLLLEVECGKCEYFQNADPTMSYLDMAVVPSKSPHTHNLLAHRAPSCLQCTSI